jgi:hypothetical protein
VQLFLEQSPSRAGFLVMPRPRIDPEQTIAHLEQAERHVREGSLRLERQRALLAELEEAGHPTDQAKILLEEFELALASQVDNRDRLRKEAQGHY